jgi:REP element-mobilizing transposase RayT
MSKDSSVVPMSDPLAYFLTWTTYGTWLPGDERGWVERPGRFRSPDPRLQAAARSLMTEEPCLLAPEQRRVVEETIARHCAIRRWQLHAVNCRTNHVHVVVTTKVPPNVVRNQFKSWCTRRLKELQQAKKADSPQPVRANWWTERGSERYLNDEQSLAEAIQYVLERQ